MNIFGKMPHDYKWLSDLKAADEAQFRAKMRESSKIVSGVNFGDQFKAVRRDRVSNQRYATMNGRALNDSKRGRTLAVNDQVSQGITYFQNNLEAIQAEIEEILYSAFRLPKYFPMNTSIPEGATSYFYRVVNKFGQGDFIENFGTDAPTAQVSVQKVNYNLQRGGITPVWSREDLRNATFSGVPLDTETIDAATTGCMQHIEQVGLGTARDQLFEGLLNVSSIPVETAPTPWTQLPPDQLLEEINNVITSIIFDTEEIFGGLIKGRLAIYCPPSLWSYLVNTPRSATTDTTIWGFLSDLRNNAWSQYTGGDNFEILNVKELETAGVNGTPRVLFGFPDERKIWEMGMSISPRVITILDKAHYLEAPMEYKISGLNVKYSGAGLRYVDNVASPAAQRKRLNPKQFEQVKEKRKDELMKGAKITTKKGK